MERTLRNCFHPKKGKPNLKKVRVNPNLVEQHIDKANSNLRAMQRMFDGARWIVEDAKDFVLQIEEVLAE